MLLWCGLLYIFYKNIHLNQTQSTDWVILMENITLKHFHFLRMYRNYSGMKRIYFRWVEKNCGSTNMYTYSSMYNVHALELILIRLIVHQIGQIQRPSQKRWEEEFWNFPYVIIIEKFFEPISTPFSRVELFQNELSIASKLVLIIVHLLQSFGLFSSKWLNLEFNILVCMPITIVTTYSIQMLMNLTFQSTIY